MFERYTDKARRVIFFARYEASQYGSPYIETEHLLLGLLREDRSLADRVLKTLPSTEMLRMEIEDSIEARERISTSVEVPLSSECKRILNYAAEESQRLGNRHIGTEHLLLAILREEGCRAADILKDHGVTLDDTREKIADPKLQGYSERIHTPASVPIGAVVDMILEAWDARDAKKLASLFDARGQFWDVHGELWLTPPQVEKGLAAHFASAEPVGIAPDVKDVKPVAGEIAIVTVVWKEQGESKERSASALRMVLVLRDAHPGWLIVSIHLAELSIRTSPP
jgi:uncharacterized protein (TIGR02246 family)